MITLLLTVFLLFLTAIWIYNTHTIRMERIRIKADGKAPVIMVHISDLHGKSTFLNGRLSKLINRVNPDVVCVTGDLANRRSQLTKVLAELRNIRCSHQLFVPGNYEREEWLGWKKNRLTEQEYRHTINRLKEHITVLENDCCMMEINGRRIRVHGLDNSIYGNERLNPACMETHGDFTLVMAHSPAIVHVLQEHKLDYQLLLAGHTHGGQIRLGNATFGAYKHYHTGMKLLNGKPVYINRGIGTAKIPVRFNCFPEITIITLERAGDSKGFSARDKMLNKSKA
ncbi:MAG: metallophosphoesterase [Clostridia bacterium]